MEKAFTLIGSNGENRSRMKIQKLLILFAGKFWKHRACETARGICSESWRVHKVSPTGTPMLPSSLNFGARRNALKHFRFAFFIRRTARSSPVRAQRVELLVVRRPLTPTRLFRGHGISGTSRTGCALRKHSRPRSAPQLNTFRIFRPQPPVLCPIAARSAPVMDLVARSSLRKRETPSMCGSFPMASAAFYQWFSTSRKGCRKLMPASMIRSRRAQL